MSADLSKAYELLGVKPGVSVRDLKTAHRDLAKVWHPDRFLHDPRLQEMAQEKLKEINEAYELISSGKVPRSVNPPPRAADAVQYTATRDLHGGRNWPWAVLALVVFAAVFAVTTSVLLQRQSRPLPEEAAQAEEFTDVDQSQSMQPDSNTRGEIRSGSQRSNSESAAPEVTAPASITSEPTPAVATVTVLIDPETGLLAKPECPLKSRMSYPNGSQPNGYCNVSHAPPPKESRLKSITKTVKRTLD